MCEISETGDGFTYQNEGDGNGQYSISYASADIKLKNKIFKWKVCDMRCCKWNLCHLNAMINMYVLQLVLHVHVLQLVLHVHVL